MFILEIYICEIDQHTCLPIIPVEDGFWVHFEFVLICLPIFVNNTINIHITNVKFEIRNQHICLTIIPVGTGFHPGVSDAPPGA